MTFKIKLVQSKYLYFQWKIYTHPNHIKCLKKLWNRKTLSVFFSVLNSIDLSYITAKVHVLNRILRQKSISKRLNIKSWSHDQMSLWVDQYFIYQKMEKAFRFQIASTVRFVKCIFLSLKMWTSQCQIFLHLVRSVLHNLIE